VPTLTCGLVRSNFAFAISFSPKSNARVSVLRLHHITDPLARARMGV
jgi:hypothetical protein